MQLHAHFEQLILHMSNCVCFCNISVAIIGMPTKNFSRKFNNNENEQKIVLRANLFLINKCVSLKFADFFPERNSKLLFRLRDISGNKVSHVNYVFWWIFFFFTITIRFWLYYYNRQIMPFRTEIQRPKDWAMAME